LKKSFGFTLENRLILVPIYSVLSVYSVVIADKITTEYTENTEKTRIRKVSPTRVNSDRTGLSVRAI
jgi:hypothetical protein